MNNSLRDPFNLRRNLINSGAPTAANALTQLNLLRATATQVATQVTEKVTESAVEAIERGKQAVEDINQNLREREREQRERYKEKKDDDDDDHTHEGNAHQDEDMSFTVPKNVPSFSNPQRALEDRLWASSGVTARSGGQRGGGATGGIIGEGLDKVGGFLTSNRGATLPMYKDKPYAYPHSSRPRPFYRQKRCMAWFLLMVVAVAWLFGFFGQDKYDRIPSLKTSDWLKTEKDSPSAKVDWLGRREKVVGAFESSWDAYKRYAWGMSRCHVSMQECRHLLTYATQAMINSIRYRNEESKWLRKALAGSLSMRSTR